MTGGRIKAEDLPREVQEKLGLDVEEDSAKGKGPSRTTCLGRVLTAIGTLGQDDATWVLTEAMTYVRRQHGQASDTTTVIRTVARYFHVTPSEIVGRRRSDVIVTARQIIMYLLWLTNVYTLMQIGEALGNRSPATISYGFQKIAQLAETDLSVRQDIQQIKAELKLYGGDW